HQSKVHSERSTVLDDTQKGTVTVTMQKLQVEDFRVYWCAHRICSQFSQIIQIKLSVFKSLRAQTTNAVERRLEGSTLSIQCPYTAQTKHQHRKAWCHMRDGQCEPLVDTTSPTDKTQATRRKAMIVDDPMRRTMSVTMTDLQPEDSGTYFCAYRSYQYVPIKIISLNVFKELLKWELDSLSVQCPYGALSHSTGTIAWCQGESQTGCEFVQDRTLIQDDIQKRVATITMQKLQAQDTSMYQCVLYSRSTLTWIMAVELFVFKRTQQYTAKESGDVSVQCLYRAQDYGAVSKAWCKEAAGNACTILVTTNKKPTSYHRAPQEGKVTIQDDTQQGIVTITMEKLQTQDSGVYWCALYEYAHLFRMVEVTLSISKGDFCSNVKTFILLSVVLGILFILALISSTALYVRQCKQLKRKGTRQAEHTYDKPEDTYDRPEDTYDRPEDIAQLDSTERMERPKDDSRDLKYVTLNFKSQLIPEDPLYCNVEPSQTHRKPKDENVEYAIIQFKQLPTNVKG
ncbi:PREDICTED: triggering receptor expressed on myeloid cells 1, partial [Tauraco erythrolophus]|uniref:triggering receptor expressed on myeloid cells 1 n=1 Tax=Tauraco erythrolophus TaxID=121530 RepID=UPI0005234E53